MYVCYLIEKFTVSYSVNVKVFLENGCMSSLILTSMVIAVFYSLWLFNSISYANLKMWYLKNDSYISKLEMFF